MIDALRKALWLAAPETALLIGLIFLASHLHAQQNGNLPQVIQTGDSNSATQTGSPVQNGDMLVGTACWESGTTASPVTCTDLNGVVPSFTMGTLVQRTACIGNPFDSICVMQQFWGKATSTGSINVSCSTFPRQVLVHFEELSGPLAFDAENQASFAGGSNPSVSVTTSHQNDVVVAGYCPTNVAPTPSPTMQFGEENVIGDIPFFYTNWFRTGAAGSQTAQYLGAGLPEGVLSATAFKPTALTIGTTIIPDGGNGTAYQACLKAFGGSGAFTWSITVGSLQTGLSLNASTGCITGTPSAASTNAITFQVTDGSNTTTKALSLNIGASLQTIFARSSSFFSISPSTASLTAGIGDALLICYLGEDSHTSTGYMMPVGNISDSFGDVYVRADPIAGAFYGGLQCFSSKSTSFGLVNPTYNSASFTGTPLAGVFMAFQGAQPIMDDDIINQVAAPATGTTTTLTSSYTTPVPNGLLLSLSEMLCGGTCSLLTTNAPFNSIQQVAGFHGGLFSAYSEQTTTAGSYSATSNYSDSGGLSTSEIPIQTLVFLRPAVPSGTAVQGEKIRRRVN